MVRKLERVVVETREDGTQVTRLPNNKEVIDKINEIIDIVDQVEKEKMIEAYRKIGWCK